MYFTSLQYLSLTKLQFQYSFIDFVQIKAVKTIAIYLEISLTSKEERFSFITQRLKNILWGEIQSLKEKNILKGKSAGTGALGR